MTSTPYEQRPDKDEFQDMTDTAGLLRDNPTTVPGEYLRKFVGRDFDTVPWRDRRYAQLLRGQAEDEIKKRQRTLSQWVYKEEQERSRFLAKQADELRAFDENQRWQLDNLKKYQFSSEYPRVKMQVNGDFYRPGFTRKAVKAPSGGAEGKLRRPRNPFL